MEKINNKSELKDHLISGSEILVNNAELGEVLGKFPALTGILGYYDIDKISFTVDGYDFIYLDEGKNLCHVKLKPDEFELEKANQLHEREELEIALGKLGFELNNSEEIKDLIRKELHK